MADRFPANIEIGGKVPKKLQAGLVKALQADGVQDDQNEPVADVQAYVVKSSEAGLTAHFADDQARYGSFAETEEYCQKNGICFRRHSDSRYEYDAEVVLFRPDKGMKAPRFAFSNQEDSEVMIPLSTMRDPKVAKMTVEKLAEQYHLFQTAMPPLEII